MAHRRGRVDLSSPGYARTSGTQAGQIQAQSLPTGAISNHSQTSQVLAHVVRHTSGPGAAHMGCQTLGGPNWLPKLVAQHIALQISQMCCPPLVAATQHGAEESLAHYYVAIFASLAGQDRWEVCAGCHVRHRDCSATRKETNCNTAMLLMLQCSTQHPTTLLRMAGSQS